MILTCPACEASYYAEDKTIGPMGRKVKCASCNHDWFVPGSAMNADKPIGQAHQQYMETVTLRARRRNRITALSAWGTVATVFTLALAAAFMFRNEVAAAWPQSASAYTLLRLDVNRFGVEFENVQHRRDLVGITPVLSISADVRNVTGRERQAPFVRIGLNDDAGREIAHMITEVRPDFIARGEAGRFEAFLKDPPDESYSLDIRFIDPSEAGSVS